MNEVMITAVGPDRPGLVDALTSPLLELGANLSDSRMINLHGRFAVIMLVEVEEEKVETVCRQLEDAARGIGLAISVSKPGESATPTFKGLPLKLRVYAMDQPGLVHRVTHLLHHHGVNIEELQTRLEHGSYSGTPLFTMDLKMTLPENVTVSNIRRELEILCEELNCDLDIDRI